MNGIIRTLVSIGFFLIGRAILIRADQSLKKSSQANCDKKACAVSVMYLAVEAFVPCNQGILESIFWTSLVLAAYCDYLTKEIYDVVFIPGGAVCAIAICEGKTELLGDLLIFCGVQILFYVIVNKVLHETYGGADTIVLCLCAAYGSTKGNGLIENTVVMLLMFTCLVIVQAIKKNINQKGSLKEPVALVPYIAFAMFIASFFMKGE